jgi:peptide/nickel transport system permease protein
MGAIRTLPVLAITILLTSHLAVIFAGGLAPYDPTEQNRLFPYAPPTRIHFLDSQRKSLRRPFIYRLTKSPSTSGDYVEDRSVSLPVRFLVVGGSYKLLGLIDARIHLFGIDSPSRIFLLGTDAFGRDMLSRLLYGGRISLASGIIGACVSLTLAIILGGFAGFYAGWPGEIVMRIAEVFLALPWLYFLFAARAFLPLNVPSAGVLFLLIGVLGVIGWARPARLIRGMVLSIKEREYVLAARGFGASGFYLLRVHILPQVAGVVLTQAAILIPQYILAEISLSFLGLGIGEPEPSWGLMLADLRNYEVLTTYWWTFAPALLLVLILLAYYSIFSRLSRHAAPS